MKIWDIHQVCLNKQISIIITWAKFLIRDWIIKLIKKEGLLKRLENIEENENVSNNDRNKKTNEESGLSNVKSESSKKHRLEMMSLKGVFILLT